MKGSLPRQLHLVQSEVPSEAIKEENLHHFMSTGVTEKSLYTCTLVAHFYTNDSYTHTYTVPSLVSRNIPQLHERVPCAACAGCSSRIQLLAGVAQCLHLQNHSLHIKSSVQAVPILKISSKSHEIAQTNIDIMLFSPILKICQIFWHWNSSCYAVTRLLFSRD